MSIYLLTHSSFYLTGLKNDSNSNGEQHDELIQKYKRTNFGMIEQKKAKRRRES